MGSCRKTSASSSLHTNAYIPSAQNGKGNFARADKISVVSNPQKYAVFGEMAMLGLLTKTTFAIQLSKLSKIHVVRWIMRKNFANSFSRKHLSTKRHGRHLDWGMKCLGGRKTLFEACEIAMAKMANFHFVMTGESLLELMKKVILVFKNGSLSLDFTSVFTF